jgi:hypothetical protein
MTEKIPSTGLNGVSASVFTGMQLRQVLAAYGEGVLKKGWKDYAIVCDKGQTTFCVIERGEGIPQAVIYSISCTRSKNKDFYRVFEREKQVLRSESFLEALNCFRKVGVPGQKNKKSNGLKLIK